MVTPLSVEQRQLALRLRARVVSETAVVRVLSGVGAAEGDLLPADGDHPGC
jgi:hypothetical protein